jgi:ABC-2 type transport system permease protein
MPSPSPQRQSADQAYAFRTMRLRAIRSRLTAMLTKNRLRLFMAVGLTIILWGGMFWIFLDGFRFIKTAIPHDNDLVNRMVQSMFSLYFAALMVMLIFSVAILLYGSLFRARDLVFLMTWPVRTERAFLHKFQEAMFFSSWAFLLLGSPMVIALGIVKGTPFYYYLFIIPFLVTFTYIPAAIGAIVCLIIVRWLPRAKKWLLISTGIFFAVLVAFFLISFIAGPKNTMLTPGWIQEIVVRAKLFEQKLLPSWWLSSGLLVTSDGKWREGILYLGLLFSNALILRQTAIFFATRIYRSAYNVLHGQGTGKGRKREKPLWCDRLLLSLKPLRLHMRLLVVKDFRIFCRDPIQWIQFLLFFGLLAGYFINIRRLGSGFENLAWVNLISFLNLSIIGLILSTYTSRFIFPMISIEASRFWILGQTGISRDDILLSKLLFSIGGTLAPCMGLVWLSDFVLGLPLSIHVSHQICCITLCFGLSGIAVGMGARLPSLHEASPARIAAGFGGTLNLIISVLFILIVIVAAALPYHIYQLAQHQAILNLFKSHPRILDWIGTWSLLGVLFCVFLGWLAVYCPMRLGKKSLREMEF